MAGQKCIAKNWLKYKEMQLTRLPMSMLKSRKRELWHFRVGKESNLFQSNQYSAAEQWSLWALAGVEVTNCTERWGHRGGSPILSLRADPLSTGGNGLCYYNLKLAGTSQYLFWRPLRSCLYEAGWPVCELARQQRSPGLYERFDSELSLSQPG